MNDELDILDKVRVIGDKTRKKEEKMFLRNRWLALYDFYPFVFNTLDLFSIQFLLVSFC